MEVIKDHLEKKSEECFYAVQEESSGDEET